VPGILTFDDHRRLLDMKDIDAVIVASPLAHSHAAFSRHASRRQRPVFREDHDVVNP
jgi:predicted dehydrogenase